MKQLYFAYYRILFASFIGLSFLRGTGEFPYIISAAAVSLFWLILEFLETRIAGSFFTSLPTAAAEGVCILWMPLYLHPFIGVPFAVFFVCKMLCFTRSPWNYVFPSLVYLLFAASALTGIPGRVVITPLSGAAYFLSLLCGLGLFFLMNSMQRENEEEITSLHSQIDRKNKLLTTLSHELRTPLAVIKSSTEILQEERPGPLNSKQKQFIHSTSENVTRMIGITENILSQIKVEYTWFRMHKKMVDLRSSVKKVCNDIQPFITNRNQSIKYTYPNLLSKVFADPDWIQQVLINLIHNASKHIGEQGKIEVSINENEQCLVVSVSDNGSGIQNIEKPKIFDEYYQSTDPATENLDGAGLGLSIVKSVIEKHGGNVYVGSVVGLGSTFSFTLPKDAACGTGEKLT